MVKSMFFQLPASSFQSDECMYKGVCSSIPRLTGSPHNLGSTNGDAEANAQMRKCRVERYFFAPASLIIYCMEYSVHSVYGSSLL